MTNDPFLPGLLQRLPEPPRKVVILRASRIGDFICATPAFRALRHALTGAEISLITLPLLSGLAERSPHFDRCLLFPGFPGIAEQLFEPRRTIAFIRAMQAENFDLAIQFQGTGVYSNPFTLLLGARATAGFVRLGDPAGLLDAALPWPEHGHDIQRNLALSAFLGAEIQGEAAEFHLWQEDHAEAGHMLAGAEGPLIGLHPSARDQTRRWPVERFLTAGLELRRQIGGTLVLLGEASIRPLTEAMAAEAGGKILNLAGRSSLTGLGAVLQRLALLITNDTGPAHIAYALDVPTVTIFGGGDPERYGPPQRDPFRTVLYEVACRPCSYSHCPIGYVCLKHVTVEQVVAAALEVARVDA